MKLKSILAGSALIGAALTTPSLYAADYAIDDKGAHASINFRVSHLGYSWLQGRFNTFDGSFSYDAATPEAAKVTVNIDPASVNTNHAERDKHIRNEDFLDVSKFPTAKFESTAFETNSDGSAVLKGNLTLRNITQPVELAVVKIGEGKDPWGGYRAGFTGSTEFKMKDFGVPMNLGPASETVYMELHAEGIRQ